MKSLASHWDQRFLAKPDGFNKNAARELAVHPNGMSFSAAAPGEALEGGQQPPHRVTMNCPVVTSEGLSLSHLQSCVTPWLPRGFKAPKPALTFAARSLTCPNPGRASVCHPVVTHRDQQQQKTSQISNISQSYWLAVVISSSLAHTDKRGVQPHNKPPFLKQKYTYKKYTAI